MKNFKLKKQGEEIIIEADTYKLIRDEIIINEGNLSIALNINSNYKIGDIHYGSLNSIEFYSKEEDTNELIIDEYKVSDIDPDYILYEEINSEWVIIDKHMCCRHNK